MKTVLADLLAAGESMRIHGPRFEDATLKCVRAGVYCLTADANQYRARWGDRLEIASDAAYFMTYGTLPPAAGPRW